jgi:pimeloyl-ACP methyl ester carboxylesterase
MATAIIDGITTRYEVTGAGPPLLMYAPAGFDATLDKWATQGVYAKTKLLEHLQRKYTCIIFDRRECGQSGAHIMGGCMGCCPVAAFGVAYPQATLSMVLYWPVGGAKYRLSSHQRFAEHLAFVHQNGLAAVVDLIARDGKPFGTDPRGGPWASVIKHDRDFAETYAKQNVDAYKLTVAGMARGLFDRDTAPGAEPEDLLRLDIPALVVPGHDAAHATSAARYLEECLPRAEYWDVPVAGQTEETVPGRVLEFLEKANNANAKV